MTGKNDDLGRNLTPAEAAEYEHAWGCVVDAAPEEMVQKARGASIW
jgi:hypothetical protein